LLAANLVINPQEFLHGHPDVTPKCVGIALWTGALLIDGCQLCSMPLLFETPPIAYSLLNDQKTL